MELDQEPQQPELELEQASGQLIVRHRMSQVRKHMQANLFLRLSP